MLHRSSFFIDELGRMTDHSRSRRETVGFRKRDSSAESADVNIEHIFDVLDELRQCLLALAQQLDAAKQQQRLQQQQQDDASTSTSADDSSAEGPNPLVLIGRLEKLQHDTLPNLRARCERVVALKRDLVASTRASLLPLRSILIALQQTAGVPFLSIKGPFADLVSLLETWDNAGVTSGSRPRLNSHAAHQQPPRKRMRDDAENSIERQLEMIAAAEGVDANETSRREASTVPSTAEVMQFQLMSQGNQKRTERFVPISEEEFMEVSTVVRGRCKLEDVNTLYQQLYELKQQQVIRKWPATVAELASRGLKVGGISGEQKLGTLRSVGIITWTKQGIAFAENNS